MSVAPAYRPTTLIESPRLSRRLGADVFIASETHQHTGSFKFRAAHHVASSVPHPHILTASSGNFGQAMAYACQLLGKRCTVVMPDNSVRVKVQAVREYGARAELVDTTRQSRADRVRELAAEHPEAYVASAYDDPLVIEGNATLGAELAVLTRRCDAIVVPVGGGGLSSGVVVGFQRAGRAVQVFGAEPAMANDAARSLRAGHIVRQEQEPQTIADGARTLSLGQHNWAVLQAGLADVVEVPEEAIAEAVRLLFALANLKAEPTGALSIGALLSRPERFSGRAVCCVVSGGNVDADAYCAILSGG